jgi:hypothetical protein
MTTLAFDSLRFARKLRDAGVPEPQADAQAELMAEAFGFYADNILTKDHFEAVLDAKLDARFAQQEAKFEGRFGKLEKTMLLHTWMLGLLVVVLVIPQLQAWLA